MSGDEGGGVFKRLERNLQNFIEGGFARVFKGEVQPVELASALEREMDDHKQVVAPGRTVVPNSFTIELSDHDFDRLHPWEEPLTQELGELVYEHAEREGYSFVGHVEIVLMQIASLATGVFHVYSTTVQGLGTDDEAAPAAPSAPMAAARPGLSAGAAAAAGTADVGWNGAQAAEPAASTSAPASSSPAADMAPAAAVLPAADLAGGSAVAAGGAAVVGGAAIAGAAYGLSSDDDRREAPVGEPAGEAQQEQAEPAVGGVDNHDGLADAAVDNSAEEMSEAAAVAPPATPPAAAPLVAPVIPAPVDMYVPSGQDTAPSVALPTVVHELVVRRPGPIGLGGDDIVIPLADGVTVLGRALDADVRLEDPGVSRRHAEVHVDADTAAVLDLGSTNGTFVNDRPVGRLDLSDGDRLRLGTTELTYRRRDA